MYTCIVFDMKCGILKKSLTYSEKNIGTDTFLGWFFNLFFGVHLESEYLYIYQIFQSGYKLTFVSLNINQSLIGKR